MTYCQGFWPKILVKKSEAMSSREHFPHCVKSVHIRSYSGPHFSRIFPHLDWIRRDISTSPYSVRMQENAGKMWTKITQNTNTFTHFPFSSNIQNGLRKKKKRMHLLQLEHGSLSPILFAVKVAMWLECNAEFSRIAKLIST